MKQEQRHRESVEKKLLQAKHRMEKAEARNRVKERKARTRRLIQEGAILEKTMPEIQYIDPVDLEEILQTLYSRYDN